MTDRKDGGPAFPGEPDTYTCDDENRLLVPQGLQRGMSLRDYFAGQALIGLTAYSGSMGIQHGPEELASRAYELAYAMIAERDK